MTRGLGRAFRPRPRRWQAGAVFAVHFAKLACSPSRRRFRSRWCSTKQSGTMAQPQKPTKDRHSTNLGTDFLIGFKSPDLDVITLVGTRRLHATTAFDGLLNPTMRLRHASMPNFIDKFV
jgi:hypothetical protein